MALTLATMVCTMLAATPSTRDDDPAVTLRLAFPAATVIRYRSTEEIWDLGRREARLSALLEVTVKPAKDGYEFLWRARESTVDTFRRLTPPVEQASAKGRLKGDLKGRIDFNGRLESLNPEFGCAPFGVQGLGPFFVHLPDREVRVGDRWSAVQPMFFGLPNAQNLLTATTESTLTAVDGSWAVIEMKGTEADPQRPADLVSRLRITAEVSIPSGVPRRIELVRTTNTVTQRAVLTQLGD